MTKIQGGHLRSYKNDNVTTQQILETLASVASAGVLNVDVEQVGSVAVPVVTGQPILPTGLYGAAGTIIEVGTKLDSIKQAIDSLPSGYTDIIGRNTGGDFVVTYTAATQLTLTNFPVYMPTFVVSMIEEVHKISATGVTTIYKREQNTMTYAAGVLTVTGAAFVNTDQFLVFTNMGKLSSSIYQEDSAHATGAAGNLTLGVRSDAENPLADNGDYIPFMMDAKGDLYVADTTSRTHLSNISTAIQIIDDTVSIDDTTTHSTGVTKGLNLMAAATPTDSAVDANDIGMLAMSLDRRLHVDANVQIGNADVDATHPLPISKDASANATGNRIWTASNVDLLGGNAINLGAGAVGTGTLRVTMATDTVSQVKGTVADDAVATADAPVKIGAVADEAASLVADGDQVHLITDRYRQVRIAGYDETQDIIKTTEQAPTWAHRTTVEHSATLNASASTYYVIPMDTYSNGSFMSRFVMGAGSSAVIKVYATNNATENIAVITIGNWYDVSNDIIGAASLSCPAGATTDAVWFLDTRMIAEYYVVEVAYTDAADSTILIRAKLTY